MKQSLFFFISALPKTSSETLPMSRSIQTGSVSSHDVKTLSLSSPLKNYEFQFGSWRLSVPRIPLLFSFTFIALGLVAIWYISFVIATTSKGEAKSCSMWYTVLLSLVKSLSPRRDNLNRLQELIAGRDGQDTPQNSGCIWAPGFTLDIKPIACHSHNDYWRQNPLYDAIAAGCTGVEADIWQCDDELCVGHEEGSLRPERTLRTLYLDPISCILEQQNAIEFWNETTPRGIFDTDPDTSLVLLIDFKTNGHDLWGFVSKELEQLRQKGWLTYYNGSAVTTGPITVVVTGDAPFDMVIANETYRDMFFDAPLNDLNDGKYTASNSYYASISMKQALGRIWFNSLSTRQTEIINDHVKGAEKFGLVSRYWDIPSWPVSFRMRLWTVLVERGIGMLNVDDIYTASWWNWKWCSLLGFDLC
jgi:hypothetical protein